LNHDEPLATSKISSKSCRRTFAWLTRCRRHSRNCERTTASSQALVHLSGIALMTRLLALTKAA
jgi:hypothetical protein